jgi:hypothetical protein
MKTAIIKWANGGATGQTAGNNSRNNGNLFFRESMVHAAAATALAAVLVLAGPTPVNAASSGNLGGNKLQCFSGTTDGTNYGGTCSLTATGVATLDNTDGNPNGSYSGVFVQNSNLGGKLLNNANKLSFSYAAGTNTVASGGSPRFSIPIDTDGDGAIDIYAFIDTLGCNNGSPDNGTLDAINDSSCTVALSDGTSYVNWAAFVAANPTYRIASDTVPFVIADQPGYWTITNVQLGKGPARGH